MRILDCWFDPVTNDQAVDWVTDWLRTGKRGHISTVSSTILTMSFSNARLKRFVEKSALTFADGMPIVWLSKILGKPLPERVAGVEMVPKICERAAREGLGVYFFGSDPGVATKAAGILSEQIPDLIVSGCQHGYVEKDEHLAKQIRDSGAKVLFVALGCPLQEEFMEDYWDELDVQLAVGIGSALDFISGHKDRGPVWARGVGLEWFFKVLYEPRRCFNRYLMVFFKLVYYASIPITRKLVGLPQKSSTAAREAGRDH